VLHTPRESKGKRPMATEKKGLPLDGWTLLEFSRHELRGDFLWSRRVLCAIGRRGLAWVVWGSIRWTK
jgi:hypothetical protein